jgi:hypothetical protein
MRLLREPLIHFVALGAVLFLVYAVASDVFTPDASRRIEITESNIQLLAETWQRQWQRPPTEEELRGLVQARVREEVLYREALAVGLDQNDVVVRRRMVQKMELLSQDLALLADPTDQELQAFFQERQEEYRVPPRISFSHVYFNPDRRGAAVEEDARRALAELRAGAQPPQRAPELGDRFMLQYDYARLSPAEVQQQFGSRFAEALFELEQGWHGPIASGYGLHLVNVGERVESRIPQYAEIRERLVTDYNRMRSDRAKNALYEGLSANYDVEIDEDAVRRSALRSRQ